MTAGVLEFLSSTVVRLEWAILAYFLIVNSFYAALIVAAAWEIQRQAYLRRGGVIQRVLGSPAAPSISVIAPAYNEVSVIDETFRALLTLNYPNLEIVVINDGSTDSTMQVLTQSYGLSPVHYLGEQSIPTQTVRGLYRSSTFPNLLVVDKENGGKADALNAGLNFCRGVLVCAIDSDTIVEEDALQKMVRPFLFSNDVVAAGGTIQLINGCEVKDGRVTTIRLPNHPLVGFQVSEYIRAFLLGRMGWNVLGGNIIISGAFGLFRRESLLEIGGYDYGTVGEDMELVMRLRRRGYEVGKAAKIEFVFDPIAWTEAPSQLSSLAAQRDRWHRGLTDALWTHRKVCLNPRYGALGLILYPSFVVVELLAPVVEAVALIGLIGSFVFGSGNLTFALALLLVAYGYWLIITVAGFAVEETTYHCYQRPSDRFKLLLWAFLENFGYRQLTVLWRLRGLYKFVAGNRLAWGAMQRQGLNLHKGHSQ